MSQSSERHIDKQVKLIKGNETEQYTYCSESNQIKNQQQKILRIERMSF